VARDYVFMCMHMYVLVLLLLEFFSSEGESCAPVST